MNQSSKGTLTSSASDNNGKEMVKLPIRTSFDNNGCREEEEEDYVDDGDNNNNIFSNGQRLQVTNNNNVHSFPLTVMSMRNEDGCHGEFTSNENQQQPKGQFRTGKAA